MRAANRAIINGGEPSEGSVNMVNSVPKGFEDWIVRNQSRIEAANSLPYFIRDNKAVVERILNPKKTALEIAAERHAARTLAEADDMAALDRAVNELVRQAEIGHTQGKAVMIGQLPDDVKTFVMTQGIKPASDEVYMTDKQIRHALRTVKKQAGKSVKAEQIAALPSKMKTCEVFGDDDNKKPSIRHERRWLYTEIRN